LIKTPPKLQSSAVMTKRTGARRRCGILAEFSSIADPQNA